MSTKTREDLFSELSTTKWDVAIIGGGASGLGAAVDAASRGFKTVLIEQSDFAKATSSRSTKLIHGGVRYLKQGNVSLVRESLHERGLLLRNASDLVRPLEFIIPTFSIFERIFYATGLKMYDALAGRLGMKKSKMLSTNEVRQRISTIAYKKLSGGVAYFDAQFDDARLALAMVNEASRLGSSMLNYTKCVRLLKTDSGKVNGLIAEDTESGKQYEIQSKTVLNATGIFTDSMLKMDDPNARKILSVSQGTHIVVDRSFLPGDTAIIIPSTKDGRVVFIIPWHGATVIGTTDLSVPEPLLEPIPQQQEIDFLLEHATLYLDREVKRSDIRSIFCGLRPLVNDSDSSKTSKLSRDHLVKTSASGMVTLTGGKWTTYRRMAEDAVNALIKSGGLAERSSRTQELKLTGNPHDTPVAPQTVESVTEQFIKNCIHNEYARTVEDVLSRRCRLLLIDANAALTAAPMVAQILAQELGRDDQWRDSQLLAFQALSKSYLPPQ